MTKPEIIHHFSDGLYAKESVFPAGMSILKHTHNFSHLSILAKGKVVVLKGDELEIVEAPACIEIKAGLTHGVKAITGASDVPALIAVVSSQNWGENK